MLAHFGARHFRARHLTVLVHAVATVLVRFKPDNVFVRKTDFDTSVIKNRHDGVLRRSLEPSSITMSNRSLSLKTNKVYSAVSVKSTTGAVKASAAPHSVNINTAADNVLVRHAAGSEASIKEDTNTAKISNVDDGDIIV